MTLDEIALGTTNDFPIRTGEDVHDGKVRSVYWLTEEDSVRINDERSYELPQGSQLGLMVISDRISAFNVNWKAEDGLEGVPGKGAALNAVAEHWFSKLEDTGKRHHLLEMPHPLVWIVQRAEPVSVEAIARQYIAGSMWRAYERGEKAFCGIRLPGGLEENERLNQLLITPTTKGELDIPGLPTGEDADLTMADIYENYRSLSFRDCSDVDQMVSDTIVAFELIAHELERKGQIFVDTKFEFGYLNRQDGRHLGFIDEVGTPDSSRIWDAEKYEEGVVVERSKEDFRNYLKDKWGDIMTSNDFVGYKKHLAKNIELPADVFMRVSDVYQELAEEITGRPLPEVENPREGVLQVAADYRLLEW